MARRAPSSAFAARAAGPRARALASALAAVAALAGVAVAWIAPGCTTEAVDTTRAPAAFAGFDGEALVGDPVPLDGSASADPDGDALTYHWVLEARPDGSRAAIVAPRSVATTFTPDLDGTYVASLTVSDGELEARDLVTVLARRAATSTAAWTLTLAPRTCNAALGAIAEAACGTPGGAVTLTPALDGVDALDAADRAQHHVAWSFLRVPAGTPPAELSTSTTTAALDAPFTFVPPRPGEYWVAARLVGPKSAGHLALASVAVFDGGAPVAARPLARIDAPSTAPRVGRVLLDGRASVVPGPSGAAGADVERSWSLVVDPSDGADTLADLATGCPAGACRILFPTVAGTYVVGLAIRRGDVAGATALVALEVK